MTSDTMKLESNNNNNIELTDMVGFAALRNSFSKSAGESPARGNSDAGHVDEQIEPLVMLDGDSPSKKKSGEGGGGTASNGQVAVNIIISFVGAGLLGVPETFRRAGWLLGTVTLLVVSCLNIYAMLLLPKVRRELEGKDPDGGSDHGMPSANASNAVTKDASSYSAIGKLLLGARGEIFVNCCLVVSQSGFATAYIIFIAANMQNIAGIPRAVSCFAALPGLMLLVQANDMKTLSPFSLLADFANLLGLSAVFFQDFEVYRHQHNDMIHPVRWKGMLNVMAITIYSMEGIGLILSLEKSCQDRSKFPKLLSTVVGGISIFMACFGSFSYIAFGDNTQAPITLNLQGSMAATFVKCALCLALYFTYPVMMFPVWSIMEDSWFGSSSNAADNSADSSSEASKLILLKKRLMRCGIVAMTSFVAFTVPNFGHFLALVGSSICTILGFILPCYFHLKVASSKLVWWEMALDGFLMVGGALFGIVGTYTSFVRMIHGEDEGEE